MIEKRVEGYVILSQDGKRHTDFNDGPVPTQEYIETIGYGPGRDKGVVCKATLVIHATPPAARDQLKRDECFVCSAQLLPPDGPPNCIDCHPSDDDICAWEELRRTPPAAPAMKREHEWTDGEYHFRCGWDTHGQRWLVSYLDHGKRIPLDCDKFNTYLATSIASLAGLTPPEGEADR